jgi:hypothetical protein
MAISTSTTSSGGNFRCRLTFTSVQIGEVLKYSLGGSGAGSHTYFVATTTDTTEYTAMKASLDAFITAQGSDGIWEFATTVDNGTSFDFLYPIAIGHIPTIAATPGGGLEISFASASLSASGYFPTPSGTVSLSLDQVGISISGIGSNVATFSGVLYDQYLYGASYHADSGVSSMTTGAVSLYSRASDGSYYGEGEIYLEGVYADNESYLTDNISLSSTLSPTVFFSDGTFNNANIGSVNYSLGVTTVPISTGVLGSGIDGYLNIALAPIAPPSASGNHNTGGRVVYSLEQQKFHGLGVSCLLREAFVDGIKQTGDCAVKIAANPIYLSYTSYYVSGCNCTINVPISITRVASGDITFSIQTTQPSSFVSSSGRSYMPGISGTNYTHTSGNLTITTGSLSGNFPVSITAPTGVVYDFHFGLSVVDKSRQVCITEGESVYVNNL